MRFSVSKHPLGNQPFDGLQDVRFTGVVVANNGGAVIEFQCDILAGTEVLDLDAG